MNNNDSLSAKPVRSKSDWILLYLRGMAMGAADVVPGVSGGTIAFITGIYEELLGAIKSVDVQALKLLHTAGPRAAWAHINGNFLVALLAGIFTSILSLARLISYWLEVYPTLLWAFFFGLIVASVWHLIRRMHGWNVARALLLLAGAVLAYGIGELKPADIEPAWWYIFLSGAIAICAMILPGISGSFILVLLGMYGHTLLAIKGLDIGYVLLFALGCGSGLLAFSRLLSWLFDHYHDATLALLVGFLLGSLNLVWPWKHTLSFYQGSHGPKPLEQANVLPVNYEALTGQEPFTLLCVALMVLGFVLVIALERLSAK